MMKKFETAGYVALSLAGLAVILLFVGAQITQPGTFFNFVGLAVLGFIPIAPFAAIIGVGIWLAVRWSNRKTIEKGVAAQQAAAFVPPPGAWQDPSGTWHNPVPPTVDYDDYTKWSRRN